MNQQKPELGAFSISLNVRDLAASRAFYEKLGFQVTGGVAAEGWLILRHTDHVIGLFQGMFERNMLTFNPGWDQQAEPVESFTDIRELERQFESRGIEFKTPISSGERGPASFLVVDPDGNPVLFDQHV